ncbi:C-type lectin domain family 4 member M-like [Haliotis rubra]|uniref:C-type lectin domain family 4 member M-like n=1 Tax=Haliotis rubra TaxID=36100 RepID=UPI001EE5B052|nr:C-type lectin domain family 4 member M-like [Haliotis rubra]
MFLAQWDFVYLVNCKVSKFQQDSIKRNAIASYKTLSSTSLIQCAKTCAGEPECRSVSFTESAELCHMMSDIVGPEVETESLDDEGMQSYTMIVRCPPDYIFIDGTCLKLSSETSNFTEASDACLSDGAVLAQMTPITVFHEIVRRMFNDGTSPEGFFWVGSTDIEEEGTWRWNDGTPISPWLTGDPNDLGGNEDCLSLYVRAATGAFFVDYACKKDERYLCQAQPLGADSC